MKIDVDPKLAENKTLAAIIARANEFLQTLPGGAEAEAVWRLVPEILNTVSLDLRWKDPDVTASRSFSVEDVDHLDKFERKMRVYWGDFLQNVSHRLGARVRELIAAQEDQ